MICDLLLSYLQRDERASSAHPRQGADPGPLARAMSEPAEALPPEPRHLGPRRRGAERGF